MFDLDGSILLIHHWDTDGLCSAALILEQLGDKEADTWTPPLGTFYLTDAHIEYARGFDNVIICDMALPAMNVKEIAKNANVIMFDHHHQDPIEGITHINPVAQGASWDAYPSNTWVIKEKLGLPLRLHVLLGFIGDREQKIKDNEPFWKLIQGYMDENKVSFDELLELVYRIDSSYKVGDRDSVSEAPHLLSEYKTRKDILGNKKWENNLLNLEEKLENVLAEEPDMIDGIQVKRLDTPYAIISQVTRRLAWGSGKDTVVVNTGFFEDQDQLYSRSQTVDYHGLIAWAKQLGFNAGGKKDVIGAIVPKKDTEGFLGETLEYIRKNR
jgi:oligoribonuclease NrnB/cAMP/cGMP phosphodiesterase (DHH superfamily)